MAEVTRVLTLESLDDASTWRILSTYNGPQFNDMEINHCFIKGTRHRNDLYDLIKRSLLEHESHYLMIHDGREYHKVEEELGFVLKRLKESLPNLKIGIQNRERISPKTLQSTDDDPDTLSIERRIFRVKR